MAKHFERLMEFKKAQREQTRVRVLKALRTIENEISQHGTYLENNGKLNQREVCRRANIGQTTLRNPHHHETRDIVKNWLGELKLSTAIETGGERAKTVETIASLKEIISKMSAEVYKLRVENEALSSENDFLRENLNEQKLAGSNVVPINKENSRDENR
ncbi:hypothetical protein [Ruegeria faecimaris]|uniref:hypothetical protein n=1 Tax=Ruegeria faecimaris TaxID=686389 RepID=UPI0024909F8D|nr:hypothetical protein [Ruegeria faecimaris]